MFQENQLTDVTLSTETKSFQAHKLILSACSPYFRNLFISNPCKNPTVFFKVNKTNTYLFPFQVIPIEGSQFRITFYKIIFKHAFKKKVD